MSPFLNWSSCQTSIKERLALRSRVSACLESLWHGPALESAIPDLHQIRACGVLVALMMALFCGDPAQKVYQHGCDTEIEYIVGGRQAPATNKGKPTIWSASAMMASIMAARNRKPGEIVMVSLVMVLVWCCMLVPNGAGLFRRLLVVANVRQATLQFCGEVCGLCDCMHGLA